MAAAVISTMPSTTETTEGQSASALPFTSTPSIAPVVRKFKASDLPLPSATHSTIKNLTNAFKKKGGYGGYDAIRKQVWERFVASVRDLA
jgi:hypothetical protein